MEWKETRYEEKYKTHIHTHTRAIYLYIPHVANDFQLSFKSFDFDCICFERKKNWVLPFTEIFLILPPEFTINTAIIPTFHSFISI